MVRHLIHRLRIEIRNDKKDRLTAGLFFFLAEPLLELGFYLREEGGEGSEFLIAKILKDEIMGRHAGAVYFSGPTNTKTDTVEILRPEFFDDITDAIVAGGS